MKREAVELGVVALLIEIRDEIRGLRADLLQRQRAGVDLDLIGAILDYVGTAYKFSATELLDYADDRLREAIGPRDANELGRCISAAEDCTLNGKRLVRQGRGNGGVVWRFE